MKYAIISDIHGNLPALEAAIADANMQGADMFLFLGDYYRNLPWGNEVAGLIRATEPSFAIRGNNEGYLATWPAEYGGESIKEQLRLMYWNYAAFTPESLEYLTSLPESAVIYEKGRAIHLSHDFKPIIRKPKILHFSSSGFRHLMKSEPFSHAEYLCNAREALLAHPQALSEFRGLPEGVYLFGHNHLQFHMEFEGKLFVNPGSCGDPCDHSADAAYTLLEYAGGGDWAVTERRAQYDVRAAADGLLESDLAVAAPAWRAVIERQLMTGIDYFGPFVRHVLRTGRESGKPGDPVGNDVWEAAVKTWDPEVFEYIDFF